MNLSGKGKGSKCDTTAPATGSRWQKKKNVDEGLGMWETRGVLHVSQLVSPIGSVESKGSRNDRSDRAYCFRRRKTEYLSDAALFPASKKIARPSQPLKEMLLRVEAPDFVAEALFKRKQGKWRCVKSSPIIEWMTRVKNMELIKSWLLKKRCQYSFVQQ